MASQSYLRAGVSILLGIFVLGEQITLAIGTGLTAIILGVAAINIPSRAWGFGGSPVGNWGLRVNQFLAGIGATVTGSCSPADRGRGRRGRLVLRPMISTSDALSISTA